MIDLKVKPLTPETWDDFADLFVAQKGVCKAA
jgi:hypothetical protein